MSGTYVVTGSKGFIGSNLARFVKQKDDKVLEIDREGDDAIDITHLDWLKAISERVAASDGVFHLAGNANVALCEQHPLLAMEMVTGTANVLSACLRHDKPVIVASSAHVYGVAQESPIEVGHPLRPVSMYGAAKVMVEQLCEQFLARGLKVAVARLFNVYGPDQDIVARTYHTTFIHDVISKIEAGEDPVLLRGRPEYTRDFVWIDDVSIRFRQLMADLRGNALPLIRRPDGRIYPVYNIGSGETTTIGQGARLIAVIMKKPDMCFYFDCGMSNGKGASLDIGSGSGNQCAGTENYPMSMSKSFVRFTEGVTMIAEARAARKKAMLEAAR